MKNVMLSAAALMIGAVVFAQNTSNVTSTGSGNLTVVDQLTAGGSNVSNVTQEFTDNTARVDQNGTNRSLVDQQGNVNGGAASGQDNLAIIDQVGGSAGANRSSALQYGDGNYANADQDGSMNISSIQQGNLISGGGAEDNWARALQLGDANRVDILQQHDNNFGLADQTGDSNRAFMNQRSNPGSVGGSTSRMTQVGDDNFATSRQTTVVGAAVGSYSNTEIVMQNDDHNYSKLVQRGDDNLSRVNQSGSSAGVSAWANRADVDQQNNLNTSRITQGAEAGVITNNLARVRQDGSVLNNTSNITQNGANTAIVTQNN